MAILVAYLSMFLIGAGSMVGGIFVGARAERDSGTVKVYIASSHERELKSIARQAGAIPYVDVVEIVTADEALDKAKVLFKDDPDVIANLPGNPFPASVEVTVDPDHREAAIKQLEKISGVDDVG
jgi:cell division protein FtsX